MSQLFCVSISGGYQCIVRAMDKDEAKRLAKRKSGISATSARVAKPKDLEWVRSMGGRVPR